MKKILKCLLLFFICWLCRFLQYGESAIIMFPKVRLLDRLRYIFIIPSTFFPLIFLILLIVLLILNFKCEKMKKKFVVEIKNNSVEYHTNIKNNGLDNFSLLQKMIRNSFKHNTNVNIAIVILFFISSFLRDSFTTIIFGILVFYKLYLVFFSDILITFNIEDENYNTFYNIFIDTINKASGISTQETMKMVNEAKDIGEYDDLDVSAIMWCDNRKRKNPAHIISNIVPLRIEKTYFYPSFIFTKDKNKIIVNLRDVVTKLGMAKVNLIEHNNDMEVEGTTYKHITKGGARDKRFREDDNTKYYIVKVARIIFASINGKFKFNLYLSNNKLGEPVNDAINNLINYSK